MKFPTTSLLVAAIAVGAYFGVDTLLQKQYPVHSSGAVVITGASSGIGRDAAITLAQQHPSYTVYATVRSQNDVDGISGLKIKNLKAIILDVTDHSQIAEAAKTIAASGQPLVALVNNAGIMTRGPVEAMDAAVTRKMFEVNVLGLLETTKHFLPLLRESQGRIVNVGSIAGLFGSRGYAAYCGTKYAVEGISDSLRREVDHLGISVSVVEPGLIASSLVYKIDGAVDSEKRNAASLPPHLAAVYGKNESDADQLMVKIRSKEAPPSTTTTPAIIHAVTSPTPRTRYVVGPVGDLPAVAVATLFHYLPDRLVDILIKVPP